MEGLLIMLLMIGLVIGICGIVSYVLMGLSLSSASKIEGIENGWFAWVPLLSMYTLLKLGNKNTKYMWLIAGVLVAGIMSSLSDSILFSLLYLGLGIWSIIVQIQAYINISKKYEVNPAWFIVGVFISPIMMVAFIILYKKVKVKKKATN